MFLPSVVQSTTHLDVLVSCYRRQMNKFSKMKVHWRTYNHCFFMLYLANVVFRYGWISDTKFLKFSDKDWIWICKNFSDMKQELKIHIHSPLVRTSLNARDTKQSK